VILFSTGSTDIIAVYLVQTEIKTRKLNPNDATSVVISLTLVGGALMRENALIDSASPKIRSDRLSIRGIGLRLFLPLERVAKTSISNELTSDDTELLLNKTSY
jgi:hypothetical protein